MIDSAKKQPLCDEEVLECPIVVCVYVRMHMRYKEGDVRGRETFDVINIITTFYPLH